jgi:Flp pilus assembly protein TadD
LNLPRNSTNVRAGCVDRFRIRASGGTPDRKQIDSRLRDEKGSRMPSPLGSIIRFAAILGCAGTLAACTTTSSTTLGKDQQAPAMSKELLKNKDDSLLRVAQVARDAADYPSAIRLFRTLLQSGDNRAEVHLGLADCLFLTGAYTEATAEYRSIDENSPKIAEAEIGLGRVFLAQHKVAEANVQFVGALKRLPDDTRALNGAGVALDDLGQHEDAQQYYQRGLAISPDDRTLRNNYGLSLALAGAYPEAVAVLRPLVDEPGATARNRQNLALALALSGARTEAQKIARVDLDTASVTSNMRFYEALRATPSAAEPPLPASAPTPAPSPLPVPAPEPAPVPVALAPPPVAIAAAPPPAVLPTPTAAPEALEPSPAYEAPAPASVAVAPAPHDARPAETKGNGQFALQLAVYQKISGIAPGWQKYKSAFADVVGTLEPRVAMIDLGDGRGPLYRLKVGPFHSAAAAQAACQRLKSGGSDCKVSDFDGAPAQEYWKEHQIE